MHNLPERHILQLVGEFSNFYRRKCPNALCHCSGSHAAPVQAPCSLAARLQGWDLPSCATKVFSAFTETLEHSQELTSLPQGAELFSGPCLKTAVPLELSRWRKSPETFLKDFLLYRFKIHGPDILGFQSYVSPRECDLRVEIFDLNSILKSVNRYLDPEQILR